MEADYDDEDGMTATERARSSLVRPRHDAGAEVGSGLG